ncbi:hypothetical protein MLD38_033562 [Melastoma candidum]|uniref:Uncharacterized protein n=1 Tax=Melastoma candidum TaxID=119954 RepID=A0ACB9M6V0_9MYRT|nr:hypothetical protein MLD38_033562 [Melastoma candidum]
MASCGGIKKSSSLSLPTMAVAEAASCCLAVLLVCFVLMASDSGMMVSGGSFRVTDEQLTRGTRLLHRPCDEIYVVSEGETLHTISDKCGDPFIVERNPHIHDPDDVFPGLVIKITPSRNRKLLR